MNSLHRYRVTGVSKSTGADAQVEVDALNEANARVKAELRDIVVTSIEQITFPLASGEEPTSPMSKSPISADAQATQQPVPTAHSHIAAAVSPRRNSSSDGSSRRWRFSVTAAVGWVVFAVASLAAIGPWVGPNHHRDLSIEAMMASRDSRAIAGSIGFLLGSNIFGVIAAMLGFVVFLGSKRTAGKSLVAFSLVTIAINVAGQCRPSSHSLSGTGLTNTTTPQAKQAVKDMSRMFEGAIPPPGEAPSVERSSIASTSAHGELSHLVKVTQDLVAGMLEDANEYQSGLLALRLDSILLPMRLDSASEINDSKAKIAAAQQLFYKYDAAVRVRMKAARDGFASAPYASNVREDMMREFDKGMATTLPQLEKVLSYEAEMYVELTVLLDFMLSQQGRFEQVGNQLKFSVETDAATYNASLTRYQAISAKQVALRELMQEGARANVNRLRQAADMGVFDETPTTPIADCTVGTRVELSADGPSINGKVVAFPLTIAEITKLLGPPSRTVPKVNTIRVWDALGIYIYSKPGSPDVDSIAIAINKQRAYDFSPKCTCTGPIFLASVEVSDIDTPRSLNRRLSGVAFKSFDPWGFGWDIHFPTYSVGMLVDKGGLSDTITIRSPKSDGEEDVKPKF